MNRVLGKDEPDVTVFARRQLIADGVEIHEGIDVKQVAREGNAIAVTIAGNGAQSGSTTTISGSHLLVAAGRRANVEGLGLDAAGVVHSPRGIAVDARRSEEHTSELQSLMRISYAVFCLKKKNTTLIIQHADKTRHPPTNK